MKSRIMQDPDARAGLVLVGIFAAIVLSIGLVNADHATQSSTEHQVASNR